MMSRAVAAHMLMIARATGRSVITKYEAHGQKHDYWPIRVDQSPALLLTMRAAGRYHADSHENI
jgi:hypothetical protein